MEVILHICSLDQALFNAIDKGIISHIHRLFDQDFCIILCCQLLLTLRSSGLGPQPAHVLGGCVVARCLRGSGLGSYFGLKLKSWLQPCCVDAVHGNSSLVLKQLESTILAIVLKPLPILAAGGHINLNNAFNFLQVFHFGSTNDNSWLRDHSSRRFLIILRRLNRRIVLCFLLAILPICAPKCSVRCVWIGKYLLNVQMPWLAVFL